MKWRMGILLLAAAFLAGLLLVPGRLLAVQEQRLYGRKTAQDVLSPQFAADTGTLFQRLNTLAQYHQVTYLSLQAGSDLYYDQETLLELYRQELSTLAQTNELAASLLPALEDLLERQRLYQDALEVGYACVVDRKLLSGKLPAQQRFGVCAGNGYEFRKTDPAVQHRRAL